MDNKHIYYLSWKFRLQWPSYVGYIIGWDGGMRWKIYYKEGEKYFLYH